MLLLGDRYGWVPEEGPKGGLGKSVTHLEFEEARQRGLTVLPFAKELKYSSKPATDDEQKRNDFRNEVFKWVGYFRGQQFRNCFELADLVGAAIVELISEQFQRARIEARVATREPEVDSIGPLPQAGPVDLPPDLVEAVRTGRIVMHAGEGISLAAGLPSGSAFATRLVQAAVAVGTTLPTSVVGAAFTNIATDIELLHGRTFLVDATGRCCIHRRESCQRGLIVGP